MPPKANRRKNKKNHPPAELPEKQYGGGMVSLLLRGWFKGSSDVQFHFLAQSVGVGGQHRGDDIP